MITWHPDYLYSFDLNSLDNKKIFNECLELESYLKTNLENPKEKFGSFTTSNYEAYNLFTFPLDETNKLYKEIVTYCSPLLDENTKYWIQCWSNIFRKGDFIDWHGHWDSKYKAWHGFYCVNTDNSFTEYKIPHLEKNIKVQSKNNRLVIGKSDGDKHKSSLWDKESPRITIAFDIIPLETLKQKFRPNHYIPFK